eukprot:8017181-Heterocapsa_arctica.AAC.1
MPELLSRLAHLLGPWPCDERAEASNSSGEEMDADVKQRKKGKKKKTAGKDDDNGKGTRIGDT